MTQTAPVSFRARLSRAIFALGVWGRVWSSQLGSPSRRRWRVAFYVAGSDGCVKNFFMLLDDWFVWKMKAIQKEVEAWAYALV